MVTKTKTMLVNIKDLKDKMDSKEGLTGDFFKNQSKANALIDVKCPFNSDCNNTIKSNNNNFDYYCIDCGKHFKDPSNYKTGTFIMGRCTITVLKDKNGYWQLAVTGRDFTPSYKEVIQARYKYLPDSIVMAQIFANRKDFNLMPENTHFLTELSK